ncbi:MAG: transporter, partial [Gammaproteobacteria bacterium]|nr:transporter [Gammaproteobacteria bacterium]
SYIAALSTRYGITNRWEVELRAPYLWRDDTTRSREFILRDDSGSGGSAGGDGELEIQASSRSADANDFGDLELGIRYQFPRRLNWPFLTGNLRIKADTGTDPFEVSEGELSTGSGFWSLNPSVTFIYPSDPVVFFGNLGYLWTLEDDKGVGPPGADGNPTFAFGDVDPGDAFRFNFGMGFSLNDRSSFSLSYSLDIFDETEIELAAEQEIAGSDVTVGRLLIGYSLRLPNGSPLNLSIGIGATDTAPDSDITFRMPFNFLN